MWYILRYLIWQKNLKYCAVDIGRKGVMVRNLLKRFLKKNWKRHIEWSAELKNNEEKMYILYIKWKGYDNLFNSWLDKKRHNNELKNGYKNESIIF